MTLRVAIGLGCRKNTSSEIIVDLVRQALAGLTHAPLQATLYATDRKSAEAGMIEAARALGYALEFLPENALAAAQGRLATQSERVRAMTGVGSVAEAAALVGGGPDFELVTPRLARDGATCAIAADKRSW
jgi:cobalt-precorrin 5A hydrolase